MSFYLTGFGDEISPDLDTQLAAMRRLEVEALDLRSAFGKNVLDLTDEEVDRVLEKVEEYGLRIQTVSSPVNKIDYHPDRRAQEMEKLRRAAEIAKRIGIARIRIFTPQTDYEGSDREWPAIRDWIGEQVAFALSEGVVLLHENDGYFFGAFPANARRLFEEFGGPSFRAVYDFGNTVRLGFRTMRDWLPWLLPHLDTLHIKDADEARDCFVPPGEGDGEILECLQFLHGQGWSGPLTIEPHAHIAGSHGGFSGEQGFEYAVGCLRRLLANAWLGSPDPRAPSFQAGSLGPGGPSH